MCTYATEQIAIDGSAQGPGGGWFRVTDATVYFDHPVHAMAEHTLNIDLAGAGARPVRAGGGRAGRRVGRASSSRRSRPHWQRTGRADAIG